ncbi:protein kinase domain-containing protein [Helicovermis profundi]|uniref:non-specific serine/threonine protein kinase n=1 Tax=Helicovermis profundi TaxID=3065157 RepID=A0AAU9EPK5_9FIRM|nr:hypothetical protein HLPR_16170 [Clostridia bacterium S502]
MEKENLIDEFESRYPNVGVFEEKYNILETLSRTKYSNVYKVIDNNGAFFACKEVSINESELVKEYKILNKLAHDALPKVYEIIESIDSTYIIMEFIDGLTIEDAVKKDRRINLEDSIQIMLKVIDVVSYLHKNKVIHRDLKPQNIMITKDKKVKLIDFNAARTICEGKTNNSDTIISGTRGYAAPEQYGFSQTTFKSDIFSLGCTFFYMLSGELLYDSSLGNKLDTALMPIKVKKFIKKSTAFNPNDRYKNLDEFRKKLYDLSENTTKKNSNKIIFTLLITFVLFGGIFTVFILNNFSDSNENQSIKNNDIKIIEKEKTEVTKEVINSPYIINGMPYKFEESKIINKELYVGFNEFMKVMGFNSTSDDGDIQFFDNRATVINIMEGTNNYSFVNPFSNGAFDSEYAYKLINGKKYISLNFIVSITASTMRNKDNQIIIESYDYDGNKYSNRIDKLKEKYPLLVNAFERNLNTSYFEYSNFNINFLDEDYKSSVEKRIDRKMDTYYQKTRYNSFEEEKNYQIAIIGDKQYFTLLTGENPGNSWGGDIYDYEVPSYIDKLDLSEIPIEVYKNQVNKFDELLLKDISNCINNIKKYSEGENTVFEISINDSVPNLSSLYLYRSAHNGNNGGIILNESNYKDFVVKITVDKTGILIRKEIDARIDLKSIQTNHHVEHFVKLDSKYKNYGSELGVHINSEKKTNTVKVTIYELEEVNKYENNEGQLKDTNKDATNEEDSIITVDLDVVHFEDKAFEKLVRRILGIGSDVPLTKLNLDTITYINVIGNRIYDRNEEFSYAIGNLDLGEDYVDGTFYKGDQYKKIKRGEIKSLKDLKYLTNCEEVVILKNRITDVSGFRDDIAYKNVDFTDNYIKDITPLRGKNILVIALTANDIKDITPLSSTIKNLYGLYMGYNELTNVELLKRGSNLTTLELNNNLIENIIPLENIGSIQDSLEDVYKGNPGLH